MLSLLKKNEVIETGSPEYPKQAYERTVEALEQIYGPIEQISERYIEYFNQRK